MGMYKITTFVILIFGFHKCHNAYKSDLDESTFCFFNTSWFLNDGQQNDCRNVLSQHNIDIKKFYAPSLSVYELIDSKPDKLKLKSLTSCQHLLWKENLKLEEYENEEEQITISNRRRKREEDEDNKESEVLIQFLIQVAEYFQLKELLFVIDKTSLIG